MNVESIHTYELLEWIDENKINFELLSRNPYAIELLEKNPEKINWINLADNPKDRKSVV